MYLSDDSSYPHRPDTLDQRHLYTYIRDLSLLPDDDAIQRFYRLLWDGNAYPNQTVTNALKAVVSADDFKDHRLNLINRCYYTLANPWHMQPQKGNALARLILELEDKPESSARNRTTNKLRTALLAYRQDERYKVLKKHLRLVESERISGDQPPQTQYFGDLFSDYFFLYEAGTQTPDISRSPANLNEGILHKRNKRLSQFGQDLNRFYVRSQHTRSHHPDAIDTANPTHLSDADLVTAIHSYRPKRPNSFKRRADQFRTQSRHARVVGDFKQMVLNHVAQPISQLDPYSRHYFGHLFEEAIAEFHPNVPLTQTMRINIFRRLIRAILKESEPTELAFSQIIHSAGTNIVTSLLLNIVLSCQMVRFELEKRFAHLHHQFFNTENASLQWLLEAFDHMNVALALNAKYLGYFNLGLSGELPDSV